MPKGLDRWCREMLVVATLASAWSCDNAVDPADLAGTYELRTVEASPLPTLILATVNCDLWLTDGQLNLEADGAAAFNFPQTMDCSRGGGLPSPATAIYAGTLTVEGDNLQFTGTDFQGLPVTFGGAVSGGQLQFDIPELFTALPTPATFAFAP